MPNTPSQVPVVDEQKLIQGCQQGDSDCWQRLYGAYRQDTWRILQRLLGPLDELEDLVQKVFLKVYRSLNQFEGRSKFSTWLYRICVHVAMDHLRHKRRRRDTVDITTIGPLVSESEDPIARMSQKEMLQTLTQSLTKLDHKKRNVLILHDLMEVSTTEIARVFNIEPATVRTRLFYARRQLARILAKSKGRHES